MDLLAHSLHIRGIFLFQRFQIGDACLDLGIFDVLVPVAKNKD